MSSLKKITSLPSYLQDVVISPSYKTTMESFDQGYLVLEKVGKITMSIFCCCRKNRKKKSVDKEDSIIQKTKLETIKGFGPIILTDLYKSVPKQVASYISTYKIGFATRYLENKVETRTNYRTKTTESIFGKSLSACYTGISAWFAEKNIDLLFTYPFISLLKSNSEELSNNIAKLLKQASNNDLLQIFINTIGKNIKIHTDLDLQIPSFCETEQQKMIYRLHFLNKKHIFPIGFPDSNKIGLSEENLDEMLDQSMMEMLECISNDLIELIEPKAIKDGTITRIKNWYQTTDHIEEGIPFSLARVMSKEFFYFFYWLEIKDQMRSGFKAAMKDYVVKQIIDPHALTILILYSLGYETTDLEKSAFGIGKSKKVLKTGQKLFKLLLQDPTWTEALEVFDRSKLRANPMGVEAFEQREICENVMANYLSHTILDAIQITLPKGPSKSHLPSPLLPKRQVTYYSSVVRGTKTIASSLLHTATYFTQSKESLATWIIKQGFKKRDTDAMAKNLIEILSHPMVRFIILELLHTTTDYLKRQKTETEKSPTNFLTSTEYSKIIISYLLKKALPSLPKIIINPLTASLETEVLSQLTKLKDSSSEQTVNEMLEIYTPVIKEYILYARITTIFRKACISMPDDRIFWEIWLREYLQIRIDEDLLQRRELPAPKILSKNAYNFTKWNESSQEIAKKLRAMIITELFNLTDKELIRTLKTTSATPKLTKTVEENWQEIQSWKSPTSLEPPPVIHSTFAFDDSYFEKKYSESK